MNPALGAIMKTINKQMTDEFEKNLSNIPKDKLTKKTYSLLLINTFIGLSKSCFGDNNSTASETVKYCINGTSLCGPEYKFFEKLVDLWNEKKLDMNDLKEIESVYNETTDLAQCQLGKPIFDCITVSKKCVVNN